MRRDMGRKHTHIIVALALLVVPFITNTASAGAAPATEESMTLTPVDKHYALNAGETKTDSFEIINSGKADYTFLAYARPYSPNGEA